MNSTVIEYQAGRMHILLNRPDRGNALSPEMVDSLVQHLQAAYADDQVHTVLLQGRGPHFCTGFDLSNLEHLSDGDLLWRIVQLEMLLALVWRSPVRTVAVAQGRAWGAGADLFAACERRCVLPGATLRFPGVNFGIALGTRRLSQRVGEDTARRWLIEGGEISAQSAHEAGLATDRCDSASEFITQLRPPIASVLTGAYLREATRSGVRDQADADLAQLVRSAAVPGLRDRILHYREQLRAARTHLRPPGA